jgi:hypothetical protein
MLSTKKAFSPHAPNSIASTESIWTRPAITGSACTLVADDGETPIGSLFVVDAEDRTTLDAFTRSDPYYVNGVWETVEIHAYRKKRGS